MKVVWKTSERELGGIKFVNENYNKKLKQLFFKIM